MSNNTLPPAHYQVATSLPGNYEEDMTKQSGAVESKQLWTVKESSRWLNYA
ncbi:hypothetical protein LVD15_22815 [Fulvivirga maritima]|uniref:hypothetical protein n=1 Tax=Fulvivirga maritima TaxID=2904247 RepID=UPI001F240694|nr:hypothetical protein [Fulvivirga maritima]UII26106.1 hypothetical protein LVD15_22815 [Fulvivirga maritima]